MPSMTNIAPFEAPIGFLANLFRKAWKKADDEGKDGTRSHEGVRAVLEAYDPYIYVVPNTNGAALTATVDIAVAGEIAVRYAATSIEVWQGGREVGLFTNTDRPNAEWDYETFSDDDYAYGE